MTAKKQKSLSHRIIKIFVPHRHNNYHPWISRIPGLVTISIMLITMHITINALGLTTLEVKNTDDNRNKELLEKVNQARNRAGAGELSQDSRLSDAAQAKAEHMIKYDYWDHVAPDGTEAWNFLSNEKYFYQEAAENLARGFRTPDGVVAGWQASEPHRIAMLNDKYDDVGFGVVNGNLDGEETTVVVGLFAKKLEGAALQSAKDSRRTLTLQGETAEFVASAQVIEFSLLNPLSPHSTLTLPGQIALVVLSLLAVIYLVQHFLIKRQKIAWKPMLHQHPLFRIVLILSIILLIVSTSFGSIG